MNTTIIYYAYWDYLRREVFPDRWDMYPDRMWSYHARIAGEGLYRKGAFACRLCATGQPLSGANNNGLLTIDTNNNAT